MSRQGENLLQLGKFFYALASLTYGGAVLTLLLDYDSDKSSVLVSSIVAFLLLAVLAWVTTNKGNRKKNK